MKTQLHSRRESGFTYMTVVITMIVVGLMLAAYLKLVAVQNQLTSRSQTWNRTVPIIEAGVEEALAHLNKNGSPDSGGAINMAALNGDGWKCPVGSTTGPWSKLGSIDGDYYFVQVDRWTGSTTNFPFINSTGFVQHSESFALNRSFGPFVADLLDILTALTANGRYSRRVVQCTTTNVPTFTKALVARRGIDLNGNNVRTDSFDSRNPAYNDGIGHYSSAAGKWRDNGDIASNDTITNTISVGNADVYGRVSTGPNGTVSVGASGAVGNKAWHAAGNNGIQPGYSTDDMNVEFPDVVMPSTSWLPPPIGGTVDGVSYNYVFNISGDYAFTSSSLNGKVLISAPNVRIKIGPGSGWTFTGQEILRITTNGSVKIYLDCASASIGGNGIVNDGTADQCYIFGTSRLTTLSLSGNGEQTAAIYAPYANMSFNGGGSGGNDFSGSAVLNSAKLNGHYNFHYDEALGRIGLWRGFTVTSWNEK